MALNLADIHRQFPFLNASGGQQIAYLDNAATTQTPRAVIDTVTAYMSRAHGNVHRGQHRETEVSTDAYEAARSTVQHFLGAAHADEIIFTKNATEAINLVAHSWAMDNLEPGDCIALSMAEHHANIVPWLQIAERQPDIKIVWINLTEDGLLDPEELFTTMRNHRVKLVALTGQSNVLGTRFEINEYTDFIHEQGARLLVDAAQLAAHAPINVQTLRCDFLAISGHKLYGPTGIGALYVSRDAQKEMTPFMGGGGMVQNVALDGFTPADAPACFEAGTPPVTEAIGLAAAIEWQSSFKWEDREAHDRMLMNTAIEELSSIEGLRILGTGNAQTTYGCISFTIDGVHPHDLTDIAGSKGIAMRAGHHCAQPLHRALNIPASSRISTAIYNTKDEIITCTNAIKEIIKKFR